MLNHHFKTGFFFLSHRHASRSIIMLCRIILDHMNSHQCNMYMKFGGEVLEHI